MRIEFGWLLYTQSNALRQQSLGNFYGCRPTYNFTFMPQCIWGIVALSYWEVCEMYIVNNRMLFETKTGLSLIYL